MNLRESEQSISLLGFMGSGKTTAGRILALRLKLPFKDSDEIIEEMEGISIAKIFEDKGEDYFRELEVRLLLSQSTPFVLALGGGAFREPIITHLKRTSTTIFLDLSFDEVKRRISGDKKRPLLKNPDLYGLFLKRRIFYLKAHFRVWTEGLNPSEVVEEILRFL